MSTVNQDELKAIKVLKFTGTEREWDHWSEKFVALARAGGYAGILLGTEKAPRADKRLIKREQIAVMNSHKLKEKRRKGSGRLMAINT